MDIGRKLQQLRMDAGLTQEQAAEALGVTRQTVSNWENGKTWPDIRNIVDISELYHVELDCLLKEKGQVSRPAEERRQHLAESLLDRHLSSAQICHCPHSMRKARLR